MPPEIGEVLPRRHRARSRGPDRQPFPLAIQPRAALCVRGTVYPSLALDEPGLRRVDGRAEDPTNSPRPASYRRGQNTQCTAHRTVDRVLTEPQPTIESR